MRVYVTIKQAGKKNSYLTEMPLELPATVITLGDLIKHIVLLNVKSYNTKTYDSDIVKLLTQQDIDSHITTGKVGFGRRFNRKDAPQEKSVETALSAFTDGLYRVFADDQEISDLEAVLSLQEDSRIAFIRLIFLSGRMW